MTDKPKKKEIKHKCECPEKGTATNKYLYSPEEYSGMTHEPKKCKGTNDIRLYKRDNKKLWLCSCCYLFGDKEVL